MRAPHRTYGLSALLAAATLAPASTAWAKLTELQYVDSTLPIPSQVTTVVGQLLPENSAVGKAYVSSAYDPNLTFTEDAQAFVTFVHEGAGYKNSLGYFTYTIDGAGIHVVDRQLLFPNASYADPTLGWGGGKLKVGDTASLRDAAGAVRLFHPGEHVGFFLVANGWNGSGVTGWNELAPALPYESPDPNATVSSGLFTTLDELNPEFGVGANDRARHVAMIQVNGITSFLNGDPFHLVGFEDLRRDKGADEDFNDLVFIVRSNPPEAIATTNVLPYEASSPDPDGDGVSGLADYFPKDPTRATIVRTPPTGWDTMVFEDNYPGIGDADFNDAVVQYAVEQVTSAAGSVKDLMGTYHLVARGATLDHAFGVALPGVPADSTGTVLVERFDGDGNRVTSGPIPLETLLAMAADGSPMLRLDDLFASTLAALPPDVPPYTNTSNATPGRAPASARFLVHFDQAVDPIALGSPPYDPFLDVFHGAERWDIHLTGKAGFVGRSSLLPTESGPSSFLDANGYPWLLLVPFDFRYPLERTRIDGASPAYPSFATWRTSHGSTATSWYTAPYAGAGVARVVSSQAEASRSRDWSLTP